MRVGESILHVEATQQIGIALHAVRIVDVAGLEKPEPAGLGRLDDAFQARFGKFAVADERDAPDAGLGALPDIENKIDASFAAGNRVGGDQHLVAAISVINLYDPRQVL